MAAAGKASNENRATAPIPRDNLLDNMIVLLRGGFSVASISHPFRPTQFKVSPAGKTVTRVLFEGDFVDYVRLVQRGARGAVKSHGAGRTRSRSWAAGALANWSPP
jgi:hypothetical protein